jgi:hypothetical protein
MRGFLNKRPAPLLVRLSKRSISLHPLTQSNTKYTNLTLTQQLRDLQSVSKAGMSKSIKYYPLNSAKTTV